jgi:hypothetical protein
MKVQKYVLRQFAQLLPHDVEARRAFVQSGGLQFLQVCMHMYVHVRICMYMFSQFLKVCTYVCVYICVYVYMYIHLYMRAFVQSGGLQFLQVYMHICILIRMHIYTNYFKYTYVYNFFDFF